MPIDLTKPLSWKNASVEEQRMLQCLQGNILKAHGRPETLNIFFKLDPTKPLESKRALRELANYHITTAAKQLRETEEFKNAKSPGGIFVAAFLSATGYAALGVPGPAMPDEPFFLNGMRHQTSLGALNDDMATWEAGFAQQIDGMILIGDMTRAGVDAKHADITKLLGEAGAAILHEQVGSAVKNHADVGIEHFGYVDGRSQPLLLTEDVSDEAATAGSVRWDPSFGLSAALVQDPAANDATSFGSYFIFRKLEQDVRGFKRMEQELADALYLKGEARELAGALVVGRFEDGTPVTMADDAKGQVPPNDFNYSNDPGTRCPFHAHIRKVNPRHAAPFERSHIMPRRGIPFTETPRRVHPSDLPDAKSLADFDQTIAPLLPTGGVGLLFMAYNRSLADQFVFTQQTWANNQNFPNGNSGIDPIIGQGPGAAVAQSWPDGWDQPKPPVAFGFSGFVTMRGGEYFFAPSLTFLKNL